MKEKEYRLMVIGAHAGDEEIMAGTICHRYSARGHKVHFLSLTAGDAGHPFIRREEYSPQKCREAMEAASILGATRTIFPYIDALLPTSREVQENIAREIRAFRPDTIITHWRGSIHKDHVAAYFNTKYAIKLAADKEFITDEEPFKVKQCFFGDNIEDPKEFQANIIVESDEEDEAAWKAACETYEMVRESFYNFEYIRYYQALHIVRGQLSGKKYRYGCGLMRDVGFSHVASERGNSIPGLEL